MHQYRFQQAAGGQGTTACALGVATLHLHLGKKVMFISNQRGKLDEIGMAGWSGPGGRQIRCEMSHASGGTLEVHTEVAMCGVMDYREQGHGGYDVIVTDGVAMTDGYNTEMYKHGDLYEDVWCIMGPGYAEMSKLIHMLKDQRRHSDYVLVTRQPERSLSAVDVKATLGDAHGEIIELPWEPALFRYLDGGMVERFTSGRWGKVLGETFAWKTMVAPGKKD